jgi:hypothetical protein
MSKKVELIIEIDNRGKIIVTPKGTVGKECLDLMAFLEKIEDFDVIETIMSDTAGIDHKSLLKSKIIENNGPLT